MMSVVADDEPEKSQCINCGNDIGENGTTLYNDEYVCCSDECHLECMDDAVFSSCEKCGETCYTEDIHFIDETVYCDDCVPKCSFCSERLTDVNDIGKDNACNQCYDKYEDAYQGATLAFFVGITRYVPQPDMIRKLTAEFPDFPTYAHWLPLSKMKKLKV